MTRPIVTIDGPAGAGKSTVARLVAERLGYLLVDTGALYRVVALVAKRRAIPWDDAEGVGRVARELSARGAIGFEPKPDGGQRVSCDGEDVSVAIRTQEMSQGASQVSALTSVRSALLAMQRAAGRAGGVVMEGRDIGTVVFPEAQAKFFLTAQAGVRAHRRHAELTARGATPELGDVEREVLERDRRDSTRPVAPLLQAPDAILIDSSELSVEEVVETIVRRVRELEGRA